MQTPVQGEAAVGIVQVGIVEVGPRDGYQGIGPFIATETKIRHLERLHAAGLRRIEIGSFVSHSAVPQLRDTRELLAVCARLPGLDPQVLVPNERRGREAVDAGARRLVFVLSVSEAHNRSNVRRHPLESVREYERLLAAISNPSSHPQIAIRLDIATAFDCPFTGRVPEARTLDLLERLIPLRPDAEIALCDTTGRVAPDHVEALFAACRTRFPDAAGPWVFHGHDTYGLGLANVNAAFRQGVRVFDASFGGLGGCPFAPGATGNVATEDVVWMFERMGVATGIDLDTLVSVANDAAMLPGAIPGGRVRHALLARADACAAKTAAP
jgi:hydroxymethylglutaryl-CoA lyase